LIVVFLGLHFILSLRNVSLISLADVFLIFASLGTSGVLIKWLLHLVHLNRWQ
jgi:hypothetical protein